MSDAARRALERTQAVLSGHFKLSSGLHSDTYVQKFRIFQHPRLIEGLVAELAARWKQEKIDVVAAPAVGAIVFGHELARALDVRSIFLERKEKGGAFATRIGMELSPGERVLCAEDVVTTGGSVLEMARAVEDSGAEVVGFAALIDRTGGPSPFAKPFQALLKLQPAQYPPESCPLCAKGTPLQVPGTKQKASPQ